MIYFIDTSALAKKYLAETESEKLLSLLKDISYLFVSALTELEIISTIQIAKKTRRLDSPGYRKASLMAERDFSGELITLIDINQPILTTAKKLAKLRQLKAPDAIQLATVLELNNLSSASIPFVCCDHFLLEGAKLEGLKTIDLS